MATNKAFVRCRTINHPWEVIPHEPAIARSMTVHGEALIRLRCSSCGTERFDTVSGDDGHLVRRRYAYATGYGIPRKSTPTKDEWRKQFLLVANIRRNGQAPKAKATKKKAVAK
jgi:hypothetical protein